jgi:hypothetical protein
LASTISVLTAWMWFTALMRTLDAEADTGQESVALSSPARLLLPWTGEACSCWLRANQLLTRPKTLIDHVVHNWVHLLHLEFIAITALLDTRSNGGVLMLAAVRSNPVG